jgi:hypothetical protein
MCGNFMNDSIKNEMSKLKRLVQYKNADNSVLEKQAQRIVVLKELIDSGNFIDEAEKKLAKKIFEAYLDKLDFENFSDLSTLSTLVYSEVLSKRVEKSINKCTTKDGDSFISDKLLKSHSDLTNQILHLKEKLGINREVKEDEFTALQLLKKRFAQYVLENRAEHTLWVPYTCSGCGKQDVESHLLILRVKDYEVLKHPFFSGRFLWNSEIMNDVENKVITPEQAARYLKTSTDYITWALNQKGRILPSTKD